MNFPIMLWNYMFTIGIGFTRDNFPAGSTHSKWNYIVIVKQKCNERNEQHFEIMSFLKYPHAINFVGFEWFGIPLIPSLPYPSFLSPLHRTDPSIWFHCLIPLSFTALVPAWNSFLVPHSAKRPASQQASNGKMKWGHKKTPSNLSFEIKIK